MDYINELLLDAREELKRLEHIIYVSLKYTRTVDVILNALKRLLGIYDLIIEALLEKAKNENLITTLPKSPALGAKRLAEIYPEDEELQNYLSFYSFLKNVLKLPYSKRREYRRHVTLVVDLGDCTAEVNIDNLTNCEKFAHKFSIYAEDRIKGKPQKEE